MCHERFTLRCVLPRSVGYDYSVVDARHEMFEDFATVVDDGDRAAPGTNKKVDAFKFGSSRR